MSCSNHIFLCRIFSDSIIFVNKVIHQLPLTVGPCCGDLTNELLKIGPDAYIESFASTGPKSYFYVVVTGTERLVFCKLKGITLNDHILDNVLCVQENIKTMESFIQNNYGPESDDVQAFRIHQESIRACP